MAVTFNSQRLRLLRRIDRRLTEEHRTLAGAIGGIVLRYGSGPERTISNTRRVREELKRVIWAQVVKPYYIGQGSDPFVGVQPQSPFAHLLTVAVESATRIAVEQQQATLRRVVRDDLVYRWLTGNRPIGAITEQQGLYDPFHAWVDPNGYRLSDRVWRTGIETRARIDLLLDYHIAQGTSAVDIADLLEDFLTPGARLMRTNTPYGQEGAYAARRLARTEITAAAGRATVNSSIANPFVSGIKWVLSHSHPRQDPCNDNAIGGPNGDGVYPPDQVPQYPNHPNELCHLQPVTTGSTADLVQQLRADIALSRPRARRMQGLFNTDWLVRALMVGFLDEALERIQAA